MQTKQGGITKNRKRVRDYGEVFTPKNIVNDILDMPGLYEACQSIGIRFLEPAVGEGVFLVEVLLRKLRMVAKEQSCLIGFENYSLYALSSLYGVELLEDNARRCVMNLYDTYYNFYKKEASTYGQDMKKNVLESAKFIISKNIVHGDFLTRKTSDGEPIIFSEWEITSLQKDDKELLVERTEYTLDEIFDKAKAGEQLLQQQLELPFANKVQQLELPFFSTEDFDNWKKPKKTMKMPITEVFKGDKFDGSDSN